MTPKTHSNPSQEMPVLASTSPLVTFSGSMGNPVPKNSTASLRAPILPIPGQKDATYKSALLLVAEIDEGLTHRTRHYRNRAGVLLSSLDSVIVAILNDDLLTTS